MPTSNTLPVVIDLFSGVGGLSLGAARAGFRVGVSAEIDSIASASHAINFPRTKHLERDVSVLAGSELLSACDLQVGELSGLIGGPPCQGFSLMGRRDYSDSRNDLFGHFFRLVGETQPAFYLAENVPGILSPSTKPIVDAAIDRLPKNYVRLEPLVIEAHKFGAPTTRKRVFFIGYDPARVKAFTPVDFGDSSEDRVTVGQALFGLPNVRATWQREGQAWRHIKEMAPSAFATRTLELIPDGVGDQEAIDKLLSKRLVSGFLGTNHTKATIKRFSKLKPGEIDAVYRSPRLKLDGFCPTLRAGTGKDRGSYQAVRPIHPSYPRVISPREAARLQGFPDWFVFNPTKWHSFRQIGNSVSPIVAEKVLAVLNQHMR